MATGSSTGKARLEASQKVRHDHELFLEAYERPTQIYRFLKARHSLGPLFLQRNLSYMRNRRTKNKKNRISLAKLVQTSQEDFSQEIKSDCSLNLSFESVTKGNEFSSLEGSGMESTDEPYKNGSLMEVEVILYQFRHPTPEALITSNPTSLSCTCTSLGKCVVPYSSMNCGSSESTSPTSNSGLSSVSIPGSVLSWNGTRGVPGTHMLAFRVMPLANNGTLRQKAVRKRISLNDRTNAAAVVDKHSLPPPIQQNGTGLPDVNENSQINGIITKSCQKTKQKPPIPEPEINGQVNEVSQYTRDMMRRLHRRAPGGKTLPTVSEKPEKQRLIVSIPRNILQKGVGSNKATANGRRKRTELELYESNNRPKVTKKSDNDEETMENNPTTIKHMSLVKSRKRNHTSSSLSNEEEDMEQQPPPKKTLLANESQTHAMPVNPPAELCNGDNSSLQNEMYSAELVAFDSRKECLLVDGEYELLMQSSTIEEKPKAGEDFKFPSFNKGTILSLDNGDELCSLKTMTLKFAAKWIPHPPKPRITDIAETAFDLLKLRKSYDGIGQTDGSERIHEDSSSMFQIPRKVVPRCSTPYPSRPTIFNFLYNNNTLQQTELRENFTCPWCSLDCKKLYCLLKHMTLCHPRFKFTYNPSEKGLACVDVRINKHYDTLVSSTDPVESMGKDAIKVRKHPTKLKPTTSVLVERCEECESLNLKEFTAGKQLPSSDLLRTFYHSQSCLPMLPEEKDSEEEGGIEWLKVTSMKMVDEFVDVNFGEKQFMKLWNAYMMDHRVLADKQIQQSCLMFAKDMLDELREKNITFNLMSHMIYMCDIGLVPSSTIREVFKIVTQKF